MVVALLGAPPAEQQLLFHWSRALGAIGRGELPFHQRLAAMVRLTREQKAGWPLLKLLGRLFGQIAWVRRSWKARLAVGAILATLFAVGNAGADLAAIGGGVGLPLWVLTGIVGLVAGLLVDLVKKRMARATGT
jgi:hypothetical protein